MFFQEMNEGSKINTRVTIELKSSSIHSRFTLQLHVYVILSCCSWINNCITTFNVLVASSVLHSMCWWHHLYYNQCVGGIICITLNVWYHLYYNQCVGGIVCITFNVLVVSSALHLVCWWYCRCTLFSIASSNF